ncbi:PTS sugar transporter subunit IIA [Lactobacillus kefiranofaciens]|uniref:PTS sugar transporter subunit IIA n=1 Tax=Lactobacillus kefiranofaciens TaxID=267818 RepID=UPI002468AC66|nr:PTS sugar transporter subunit IIA [Lactobacillus kefiranofaciens]MDH5100916.1 PTS sugar transporter subunit IIA [Lactobacillus kefiranofaciens]
MELLIATHEGLASGLISAHDMLAGKNDQIASIKLTDTGIRDFKERFAQIMQRYQAGQVLILTDLKNGTPHLIAEEYEQQHPDRVRVVSGVNLPMVLELSHRLITASLDDSAQKAIEIGRNQIAVDQMQLV